MARSCFGNIAMKNISKEELLDIMVENKVFMLQDIQTIFKVKYLDIIQNCQKLQKYYKNFSSKKYRKLTLSGQIDILHSD